MARQSHPLPATDYRCDDCGALATELDVTGRTPDGWFFVQRTVVETDGVTCVTVAADLCRWECLARWVRTHRPSDSLAMAEV